MNHRYIKEQVIYAIENAASEGHMVKPSAMIEVFPDPSATEMVTVFVSDYLLKEHHEVVNDPTYTNDLGIS